MNWIDRTLIAVAPRFAYNLQAWRMAARSAYDAASTDRSNWRAVNGTAEQVDSMHRDTIRGRARDLERNSDIAEGIVLAYERNVVGTGFRLQGRVLKSDLSEDEEMNRKLELLWKDWCRPRNCDVTGQQSFSEIMRMVVRRMRVDGGIFIIKTYTEGGPVPLCLQAREVDELDTNLSNRLPNGNRIVGGKELDRHNKPVAYHFKQYTPDGYYTGATERIEAKRVIDLFIKRRPTQIREMSPMAVSIPRVKEANEFMEAVGVKERVAACLSAFIVRATPGAGQIGRISQKDNGSSAYTGRTLTPGMMFELQPGEDVKTVIPPNGATNARDFVSVQQRMAGAGQGLSYEVISRDMSQVNYSSARQGLLEDQVTYKILQQYLIDHFLTEVYTDFVISAVLSNAVVIKDFWQDKERYLQHEWIPPGWSWIDPLKEALGNQKALDSNLDTLARVCAASGLDWREVMEQRARELKLMKDLGIVVEKGGNTFAEQNQEPNQSGSDGNGSSD